MKIKAMPVWAKTVCALLLALALLLTSSVAASSVWAAEADADDSAGNTSEDGFEITGDNCYAEGYEVSVEIGAEGSVLLKNDGILPLAQGTGVTVLGAMSYNYVEGGTGSAGGADDENTTMMDSALTEAGLDVNQEAWNWLAEQCGGSRGVSSTDPAGVGWTSYSRVHEFPIATYDNASGTILQNGYTDYAIVTIARSGAEGASPSMDYDGDGSTMTGTTYLELSADEEDLLEFCAANFEHTIVLINSAAAMELGFIDSEAYNIDACLWIGHPGEAGITGAAAVLSGRYNPSGALVDTYTYDVSTNPTFFNTDNNRYTSGQTFYQYEEGIYVGYRYYETADAEGYFDSSAFSSIQFKNGTASGYDEVVQFPFGYGMSYTTFSQEIVDSDISLEAHGQASVTVRVTNTGTVAGKEVVQLYMEAPYNQDSSLGIRGRGLEKAKVVLVGYAKTDILEPNASAEVTIEFDVDDLASYDNFGQGCYVLEQGTYYFNIQDNAHCWSQNAGDDNAVYDSVSVNLSETIIYNEENAGARDSDETVAENSMDDVTAGDGNMLDGYLSRSDFAGGMATIMEHTSNEEANEVLRAEAQEVLELSGTETVEYSYQTYVNGVKTTLTTTYYAKGGTMMPFGTALPDGTSTSTFTNPLWEQTYYVLEDENGDVILNDDGYFDVLTSAPTDGSAYHELSVNDLVGLNLNTDQGKAILDRLAEMTSISEAIEIQGNSGWNVSAIPSVGKEAQVAADGPGEAGNGGTAGNTWFPCAVMIAATWNDELAYREGVAYGHQAILAGLGVSYAPAMNIHRSPFGGRNFEYYSEDGFISGHIGGNAVAGIQSTGTSVAIKHMALNDGDTNRGGNTTWANEQAIREIYLLPYEISVKDYGANGIMGSLNRIGLSWFHYGMYYTILRAEWGFQGLLITDGDGSDGDTYNNAQAMLSIGGAILNRGVYINAASTMAAYGDATSTAFGQTMLQLVIRSALYQYLSNGEIGVTTSGGGSINAGLVIGIIAAVVVVAVVIVIVAVVVNKKKKAKQA